MKWLVESSHMPPASTPRESQARDRCDTRMVVTTVQIAARLLDTTPDTMPDIPLGSAVTVGDTQIEEGTTPVEMATIVYTLVKVTEATVRGVAIATEAIATGVMVVELVGPLYTRIETTLHILDTVPVMMIVATPTAKVLEATSLIRGPHLPRIPQ